MRVPPIMGAKTIAVMTSAGRLRVDDPWAMDMVASMLAPLLLNAAETGTMQAEHRVMAGPTIRPLRAPFSPPAANSLPVKPGKMKASMAPATRKAKVMPAATSLK